MKIKLIAHMFTKEDKEKYDIEYQKKNMKHFGFWLNKKKDAELIQWLTDNSDEPVSKHIKKVLISAMNNDRTSEKEHTSE